MGWGGVASQQFRLVRANGTEITNASTRLDYYLEDWQQNFDGSLDESGSPKVVSITNVVTKQFPGPGLLDLGSAVSTVALVTVYDDGRPENTALRSDGILLLNFLTTVLGVTKVTFAAGQLTMKLL